MLEAVPRRLDLNPGAMRQRRKVVEHPFGTIKLRMGAVHFLLKRLPKVRGEMALNVLERVDIHLVQMNALTRQRSDMNARGVCS